MPIRFSTEAANADHMRMDSTPGVPEGMPDDVGADGTPRDRSDRGGRTKPAAQPTREEQDAPGKPGKDINAPGFVKDKDAGKP